MHFTEGHLFVVTTTIALWKSMYKKQSIFSWEKTASSSLESLAELICVGVACTDCIFLSMYIGKQLNIYYRIQKNNSIKIKKRWF